MDNRDYLIILYDYYYKLFNDKQREYFELYYFDKLYFYENELKIYSKSNKILDVVDEISDLSVRDKIVNILKEE